MRYLYLRITGSNINLNELTKSLELKPALSFKKDSVHTTTLGERITYKEDCWQFEREIDDNDDLETEIIKHIQYLIDQKDNLAKYKKNSTVKIGAVIYSEDYQNTFVISQKIIKLLDKLTMDFLITIANL